MVCISATKNRGGGGYLSDARFVSSKLLSLLSDYWFIYIIFVPLGFAFGRSPIDIYEGNPLYFLIDFFGLNNLFFGFDGKTMNATWWYMTLAILLYIIYPIVFKLVNCNPMLALVLTTALTFIPGIKYQNICRYLYALVLGALFAKYQIFEKIGKYLKKRSNIVSFFSVSLMVLMAIVFRIKYFNESNMYDGFLCVAVILFGYIVISNVKFINKIFEILGKYSSGIFMFHTFIFSYYFKNFIYSFKYSVLIFVVLAVICLVIAVAIEWIKKIIGYNKLFNLLTKKIIKQ